MSRRADALRVAELVGEDVLRITDPGDGWPALAELVVDDATVPVALFVAPVGLSHRNRDDRERRFQNPGANRPIIDTRPARDPLLVGLWETDTLIDVTTPLLVSADPLKRLDLTTRYSVFVSTVTLQTALEQGWAYQSVQGELIRCFVPSLLARSYQADRDNAPPDLFAVRPTSQSSEPPTRTEPDQPLTTERLDLVEPPPGLTPSAEAEAAVASIESLARPTSTGRAQGRGLTGPERRAVELRAMEVARQRLEEEGWGVEDVSANHSYDLHCRDGDHELRVEVKGTTGAGASVLLTPNEVRHAGQHEAEMALFVVSEIELDRAATPPVGRGGLLRILDPWELGAGVLSPVGYEWGLPVEII